MQRHHGVRELIDYSRATKNVKGILELQALIDKTIKVLLVLWINFFGKWLS